MAHMGATIELPKQSAKQTGFGPVLTAAALIVVIGLVVAMGAWLVGSNLASGSRANDGSYDQVESLRGGTTLSVTSDTSLDKIEDIRGGAFLPGADGSYDLIDALKSGAFLPQRMPPLSGDGVPASNRETRWLHGPLE
jgi:hypothetical protein